MKKLQNIMNNNKNSLKQLKYIKMMLLIGKKNMNYKLKHLKKKTKLLNNYKKRLKIKKIKSKLIMIKVN